MVRIKSLFSYVTLLLVATSSLATGNKWDGKSPSCQSIVNIICSTAPLSNLCELVKRVNLDEILGKNNNDFTVFAPNNRALSMLPFDVTDDTQSVDVIIDVLEYHVAGVELFVRDLDCGDEERMLNGEFTSTKCFDGRIFQVGDGNDVNEFPEIMKADLEACNGVVHIIDRVLLPRSGYLKGSEFCTFGFDYKCYQKGKPPCCFNDKFKCPLQQPACDNYKENHNDNVWVGSDYCTDGFNYKCYEKGKPECCFNNKIACPNKKPVCDTYVDKDEWVGSDYCTDGFNYKCYEKGKPECCFDKKITCPNKKPVCNNYDNKAGLVGSNYCTFGSNFDCYAKGKPTCCFNDKIQCPSNQPSCDIPNHSYSNHGHLRRLK